MINCLVEIIFFCVSLIIPTSENCEPKIGTNFNNTRKQLTNSSVVSDIYEDNDDISKAYRIDEENYFYNYDRDISIDANLHYEPLNSDVDFYSFTILEMSIVDIQLNTNAYLPYVFNIYETTFSNPTEDLRHYPSIIYTDDSSSQNKTFENLLDIGVYFIEIRFLNEVPQNITLIYSLDIDINNISAALNFNVDLGDLIYNKDIPGAVWVNNLFSIENLSLFDFNKEYIYQGWQEVNAVTPLHYLDDLADYYDGGVFKVAQIYLWDPNCKATFYELLDNLINEIFNDYEQSVLANQSITMRFAKAADILDYVSLTLSFLGTSAVCSIVIDILGGFLDIIEDVLSTITMPEDPIEITSCIAFLTALKNSLFVSGLNDDLNNFEYIQALNNVFTIPIYGTINYQFDIFGNKTSYLSLKPTFMLFNENVYSFSVNDIHNIPLQQDNSLLSKGSVYLLDLYDGYNTTLTTLIGSNNVPLREPAYTNIALDISYPMLINHGNYFWFKFVVPETKRYYFKAYGNNTDNIFVSLYSNINYGYSTEDLIISKTGGYQSINDSSLSGCVFNYNLQKDDVIFIKVYGNAYSQIENIINLEINDEYPNELVHIHDYSDSYERINGSQHKAYCECGAHRTEGHYVLQGGIMFNNKQYCYFCGGEVELGFVIVSGNSIYLNNVVGITQNCSYKTSDGTVLLNINDVYNLMHNNLEFIYFKEQSVKIA